MCRSNTCGCGCHHHAQEQVHTCGRHHHGAGSCKSDEAEVKHSCRGHHSVSELVDKMDHLEKTVQSLREDILKTGEE